MNRRHFIKTTGIGLGAFLVSDDLSAFAGNQINLPYHQNSLGKE